jgi:hypothetical protein
MPSPRAAITVSLTIAAVSCALPFTVGLPFFRSFETRRLAYASFLLSAVWLITAVYAVAKYRQRALWSLLGLIPASCWPAFWVLISYACRVDFRNCL